jgi:hypothetical protein
LINRKVLSFLGLYYCHSGLAGILLQKDCEQVAMTPKKDSRQGGDKENETTFEDINCAGIIFFPASEK